MLQDVTACPKCVLFALRNCTRNENKRTSGIAYSLTALDQCHAACVNNGFRTTVVNQCVAINWLAADKRWILLLDSNTIPPGYTRHHRERRGTALRALTTATLKSMGTGELWPRIESKPLNLLQTAQLIWSTRWCNMPNLNIHLRGNYRKIDEIWHFLLLFIFLIHTYSGQTPWRILTFNGSKVRNGARMYQSRKDCNLHLTPAQKKLSKLPKFQPENV